jgi:hypothetical protein
VEALFRQVPGTTVQRPGWGLARIVSYGFAMVVHLSSVALLAVAIWLIAPAADFLIPLDVYA